MTASVEAGMFLDSAAVEVRNHLWSKQLLSWQWSESPLSLANPITLLSAIWRTSLLPPPTLRFALSLSPHRPYLSFSFIFSIYVDLQSPLLLTASIIYFVNKSLTTYLPFFSISGQLLLLCSSLSKPVFHLYSLSLFLLPFLFILPSKTLCMPLHILLRLYFPLSLSVILAYSVI